MIREHYDAIRALIPSSVKVYAWNVPSAPEYPYVCVWGDTGTEFSGDSPDDGDSLADNPTGLSLRARLTYAGLTGDSVLTVCRNVRAALNRKTPSVAGWCPGRLRVTSLTDVQADNDVTIPEYGHPLFAVDEVTLVSEKA